VALLEARLSDELGALVRRHGGEPYAVPAVREVRRPMGQEVGAFIDSLGAQSVVVFSTGAGARALFDETQKIGRTEELNAKLASALTVCRGPKPVAALKDAGIRVSVRAREPFTTRDLLEAVVAVVTPEDDVTIVHYGERSEELVSAIARRAANVRELLLYEWALPEDLLPLRRLIEEIVERRVGAVAFTSKVQVRHLMHVANSMRRRDELVAALRTHTIVAAVGPTTADALAAVGTPARVIPEHPKMGAMVVSLSRYLGARDADVA
jgi:uroporphyrinogen-III synthase